MRKPKGALIEPIRIQVAMVGAGMAEQRPEIIVTKTDMHIKPLWVRQRFAPLAWSFFCFRLVRPVLLAACFPNGPQASVVGVQVCLVIQWMGSVVGLLASLLINSFPLRERLEQATGISDVAKQRLKHGVLVLFAVSASLEGLYQLLSLAYYQFFWGLGMLDPNSLDYSTLAPVARVLVMLQVGNLLGGVLLIVAYCRSYFTAWQELGVCLWRMSEPPGEVDVDSDLEAGNEEAGFPSAAPAPAAGGRPPRAPGPVIGWERGPRQAAGGSREASPRQYSKDSQEAEVSKRPSFRRRPSDVPTPTRDRGARSASPIQRPKQDAASASDRPPMGAVPRAWLWVANETGGEWSRVRVLRSSADGTASVQLPGGGVVQTRQSMLRPRSSSDEEPPGTEPRRDRPSSATAGANAGSARERDHRRPNKERASACFDEAHKGPKRSTSVPPGWTDYSTEDVPGSVKEPQRQPKFEPEPESAGALWAKARLAKLRKELQELNNLEPAERRLRIRALQRELHPDKLPEDLRPHAQPLFHIVQREWEVDEAARQSAQAAQPAEPRKGGA